MQGSGTGSPHQERQNVDQGKTIEVGTIVKLKSGGPDMTVRQVQTDVYDRPTGSYTCQWFAGKKLESGGFPGDSLELVKSEAKAE